MIITDQRTTLDNWVDYLSSPDATYPDWLKYWTIRSILDIGEYDKEKKQFTKRSNSTTKPFIDINREALAYVLDAVAKKYGQQHTNLLNLNEQERKDFDTLLQSENFGKLYAWAIEKTAVAPAEGLANTQGKWVKYNRGADHLPLVESLQGHGTGWCTAGESTARTQLQGGDFYVYYSMDKQGKPTLPRAAIRMNGNQIAEVRGIAPDQNLDPYIGEVVQKKMSEFPDGKSYEKKAGDMKRLTEIEQKTKANQQLSKNELLFLYEANNPIQGFGYERDPRIQELRNQRNPEQDMLIIFDCEPSQIAHNPKEINQNTKVYVGPLRPGIFTKLQEYNIEHIYTSFPEGRIQKQTIEIGGKDKTQLVKELENQKINISQYAEDLLKSKDFTTLKNPEAIKLIRLKVRDLFSDNRIHTTREIFQRAEELELELCPAEVGPNLRLQYQDQLLGEWFFIGMKQINDSDGSPSVFELGRDEVGLWLDGYWASSSSGWDPGHGFVFRG